MLYLIIAIINLLAGFYLFSGLNSQTPVILISLIVGVILTSFGVWGIVLWVKSTILANQDKSVNKEAIENWWKMVRTFDLILLIGLFARSYIIQPFVVDGPSMEPNFYDSEGILVDKATWRFTEPKRGEIVIFKAPPQPEDDYIKRIIGLPGEQIKIENQKIYINNVELNEPYLTDNGLTTDENYEDTLGSNEYFVIGDNRPHSSDSRAWGSVPRKNLVGRALVIVYPLNKIGIVHKPQFMP